MASCSSPSHQAEGLPAWLSRCPGLERSLALGRQLRTLRGRQAGAVYRAETRLSTGVLWGGGEERVVSVISCSCHSQFKGVGCTPLPQHAAEGYPQGGGSEGEGSSAAGRCQSRCQHVPLRRLPVPQETNREVGQGSRFKPRLCPRETRRTGT